MAHVRCVRPAEVGEGCAGMSGMAARWPEPMEAPVVALPLAPGVRYLLLDKGFATLLDLQGQTPEDVARGEEDCWCWCLHLRHA